MNLHTHVALFPGLPRCVQYNTQKRRHSKKKGWRPGLIHHMNNVRWMQGGHRKEGPSRKDNTLDYPFKRSTVVLDLRCWCGQNYSSSPVRNLLSSLFVEYRPLPPTSTSCSLTWWMRPGLLCFSLFFRFRVIYWTQSKEQKMGEAWERG